MPAALARLYYMIISNFKNLARNSLRKKALLIAEAGYRAVEISSVIRQKIILKESRLIINPASIDGSKKLKLNLNDYSRIFLIGIGKGSALACVTLAKILNRRLAGGITLDVSKVKSQKLKVKSFVGTHPLPSKQNLKATQKIIRLAKSLKENDLLITFICGGGSALLCGSEKELKNSILATKLLTQAGADILELNTVRKHLSEINPHTKRGVAPSAQKNYSPRYGVGVKGGGLAKIAYPATVISLIVSDVIGNDLSMVASGPTVFDKTTKKDAKIILKKYNLRPTTYDLRLIETPKNKKYFKKVKNILFLSNREPVLAMAEKAKKLGFKPKIYSLKIQGEAKYALLPLMEAVRAGEAVLAAGETTVKLDNRPTGKGGRNMETVLGIISKAQSAKRKALNVKRLALSDRLVVMSFATDGRDNTEAAGAIGDFSTLEKAKKLKLEPEEFLNQNNSFNFFKKTGDLIFAKPKSFNVSDLMIILKQ